MHYGEPPDDKYIGNIPRCGRRTRRIAVSLGASRCTLGRFILRVAVLPLVVTARTMRAGRERAIFDETPSDGISKRARTSDLSAGQSCFLKAENRPTAPSLIKRESTASSDAPLPYFPTPSSTVLMDIRSIVDEPVKPARYATISMSAVVSWDTLSGGSLAWSSPRRIEPVPTLCAAWVAGAAARGTGRAELARRHRRELKVRLLVVSY